MLTAILAAAGIAALIGGIVTLGLLYESKSTQADHLNGKITRLQSELAAEKNQYTAGYNAGKQYQIDFEKKYGLTYLDGFDDGWRNVFIGFKDPWLDGSWYLVKIRHGRHGHDLQYRFDVTVCQQMYIDRSDQLYTAGYGC